MKTTDDLIHHLRDLDIKIWPEGDRLRYSAPNGTLTSELIAQLRERKVQILAYLNDANATTNPSLPPIMSVSRRNKFPVSHAQQRLWFLDQLEEKSSMYNISPAIQLTGKLNVVALEKSVQTLIQRHETLRTRFENTEEATFQVIVPEIKFTLPITNLENLSESEQTQRVKRLVKEEAQKPFDLNQAPLIRVNLLRLRNFSEICKTSLKITYEICT